MNPTLTALTGFIAWTLLLLVLMESVRSKMVLTKEVPANGFRPDNANLSPFMQRLARAHANCLEGLPIFGGLLLVAAAAGRTEITDPLAYVLLAARIVQSLIHLGSLSPAAVTLRFTAFAVQMAIAACQRAAYTGQLGVGINRPRSGRTTRWWSRRNPASA